jgi:hypothetical protein
MIHKCIHERFPKIKLFYEKNTHKKVQTDYYMAVPYGKKYFAWFTYYNNENVCIFIEIKVEKDGNYKVISSMIRPVAFHNTLSLGTIVYGSIIPNTRYFCVENVFYYKGDCLTKKTNKERLLVLEDLFSKNIKQVALLHNEIIFGMALITNSFKWLVKEISGLPYQIYCIQCKYFANNNAYKMMYKSFEHKEAAKEVRIFNVKASLGVDNYQLFDSKSGNYFEMAYIPNFQTSKLMNSIFRIIKENENLDTLEESDDEDEFENTSVDKYVDLNKQVTMECKMHPTFKKWVPVKILSQ